MRVAKCCVYFSSFWIFILSYIFSLENSSAEQLVDIGCQWVILGHSERRHVIGEDDEVMALATEFVLLLVHALIVGTQKLPLRYMVTTGMQ
jgi:hypothetical protein